MLRLEFRSRTLRLDMADRSSMKRSPAVRWRLAVVRVLLVGAFFFPITVSGLSFDAKRWQLLNSPAQRRDFVMRVMLIHFVL
jgi:hypothetical protein